MTVETWLRNPTNYIREIVEVPTARRIIWDRGVLAKRKIDPFKHAKLYFGMTEQFRLLICGEQGTAELDQDHDMSNPVAVYPTWVFGEDTLDELEDMVNNPMGEDIEACSLDLPPDERPVFGQEHRIIITNIPTVTTAAAKNLFRNIRQITEDYDGKLIVHCHGVYSYPAIFGGTFQAGDMEPRSYAANGKITYPSGKSVLYEQALKAIHWVNLLDMKYADLKEPRNRCIYNIKSFIWAGDNWERDLRFKTVGKVDVDPTSPVVGNHRGARAILGTTKERTPQEGDKLYCNSCSLQDNCKFYREDSVCSMPESETSKLAEYLGSRDASRIIDALGTVLGAQARRAERAVQDEEEYGETDPHVTRLLSTIFKDGVTLAKLIDPSLTKPGVQINVGNGGATAAVDPKQLVADAVRALEDQGVRREDITNDMLTNMLGKMQNQASSGPVIIQSEIEK